MPTLVAAPQAVTKELSIRNVSKLFRSNHHGAVHALEDISLKLQEGEVVCLVGPSGCGKSTLLNIVARLVAADFGCVPFRGRPVAGSGRDRMMIFQDSALFP